MYSLGTDLLIFHLAGGFLIMLAWAGVVGEMLLGDNRPGVRWSVRLLALLGMVHPAAALASWDLVRLGTATGKPDLDFSRLWQRTTQAIVVWSAVAAIAAWAVVATSP